VAVAVNRFVMPDTRSVSQRRPSQKVLDNEMSATEPITTPLRRHRRSRTQPPASQATEGSSPPSGNAGEPEGESSGEEDVVEDPIDLELELRTVADDLKAAGALGASSIQMAAWVQPNNTIDDDAIEQELRQISRETSAFARTWIATNSRGYDYHNNVVLRAEIS
jgi:hypothetical protein